jgi:glycosyltransferase involved in cell wall biosynthesis
MDRGIVRILFVAPNIEAPGTNGGSTHVTEVVTHLREQDDVLLIARSGSQLPQTLAIGGPTAPSGFRQLNAARLALQAYPAVKRFAPEVIYERGSAFGLGAMLGILLDVPSLCMVLDQHQTALSLSRASRLIATRADIVPERYRRKLALVRWGANTRSFRPDVSGDEVRAQLGIPRERLVVGYTGAFYAWHGLEELVQAAATLRDLDVAFLLVGEGERSAAIAAQIAAAQLGDRFVLTGRVPYADVPRYIAACDIYAAPYNSASKLGPGGDFLYDPLKIFEAMACGKPVVTLRAGNIAAMFADDRDVVLFDPGNAPDLAAKLRALVQDSARRARIGAAARATVEQHYSWSAHTTVLRDLFRQMIAEHT